MAHAHCSTDSTGGIGIENEADAQRKELLRVQKLILEDPVALDKWPRIVGHIIKSAVDIKMLKGLISKGDYAEAVYGALQLWFSYGSTLEELVKLFREEFKLNKLADKLTSPATIRSRSAESDIIWFEVGRPVSNFTGREQELETLHRKMQQSQQKTECRVPVLVCGLGGVGKSTLVRKYAYRNRAFYDGNVLWINAETVDVMRSSFLRLAKYLNVHIADETADKDKEMAAKVYAKFTSKKSLFIFDNIEEKKDFNLFKPEIVNPDHCSPYVLLTSRRSDLGRMQSQIVMLDIMLMEQAVKLVMTQVTGCALEDAQKLADKLECLPLALQQALAYIADKYGNKPAAVPNYLEDLEKCERERDILNDKKFQEDEGEHIHPVMTTWNVTLARISELDPPAAQVMNVLAYLDPNFITIKFVSDIFSANASVESIETGTAWRTLEKYSMISEENGSVRIHRLVQRVLRLSLSKMEEVIILKLIMAAAGSITHVDTFQDYEVWLSYRAHTMQFILNHSELNECEYFLRRFRASGHVPTLPLSLAPALKTRLKMLEPSLGQDHERIIVLKLLLAKIQIYEGKTDTFQVQVLRSILEVAHNSRLKLELMKEISQRDKETMNYEALLEAYDQVILSLENDPHSDADSQREALEGKADTLIELDRIDEARDVYRTAYDVALREYGKNHLFTLWIMEKLGDVELKKGECNKAVKIWREILEINPVGVGGGAKNMLAERVQQKILKLKADITRNKLTNSKRKSATNCNVL